MWLILAFACHPDRPPDDAEGDDTGGEETAGPSGDPCGQPGAPPELGAAAWSATPVPSASLVNTLVSSRPGGRLYAGSLTTGVWRSDDAGDTWITLQTRTTHTVGDVAVGSGDDARIWRSAGGELERSVDAGATWVPLPLGDVTANPPTWVTTVAVDGRDDEELWATTAEGMLWRSSDGGQSWEERTQVLLFTDPHGDNPYHQSAWTLLAPSAEGDPALLAHPYGVYRDVSGDGSSWAPVFEALVGGRSLSRDPSHPSRVVVGATDGLLVSEDAGVSFLPTGVGEGLLRTAWAPDGSWMVAASATRVWVSETAGYNAVERALPATLDGALWIGADGRLVAAHGDGLSVSFDRGETWADSDVGLEDGGLSVVVAHPACPNVVFSASRCGGGLYRSEDWGATWSHDPTYQHYVMGLHFDPGDPLRVWSVSDDALLRSDDGGLSWSEVYARYHFHGFAIDPEAPGHLLVGSVGSGEWADTQAQVYRSEDDGQTWVGSSTGLPATTASAHTLLHWPGAPEVVLLGFYKGGDVSHSTGEGIGLYRSEDRGRSWALAALPAHDVAWLAEGAGGVVAATEDGLWVSRDEGGSWEPLGGPAGPVLSVGFREGLGLAYLRDGTAWRTHDDGASWEEVTEGLRSTGSAETELAQVAISTDGLVGYVTDYGRGIARIGW